MSTDLNAMYTITGGNPQNYIYTSDMQYFPKIQKLHNEKSDQIQRHRMHGPIHIQADLRQWPLPYLLQTQFDVILIDPPWFEYFARAGGFEPNCGDEQSVVPWAFEEILNLQVDLISSVLSFCFLWAGSKHVEQATACLIHWGFRRVEDIVWLKTNKQDESTKYPDYLPYGSQNFLKSTKEHLLVGIKGSLQRSTDHYFLHANIDDDVIVAEQPAGFGCTRKPDQAYELIERFCNSQRRLELFGSKHNLRPGWVTVGIDLNHEPNNYDPGMYNFATGQIHNRYVPSTNEIEALRPKSPKHKRH